MRANQGVKTVYSAPPPSVVVYSTMARLVPDHLGKKNLEKIIDEELKHIAIITQQLATVKK